MLFEIALYDWKFTNKKWKKMIAHKVIVECINLKEAKKYLITKMIPLLPNLSKEYEYSIQLVK